MSLSMLGNGGHPLLRGGVVYVYLYVGWLEGGVLVGSDFSRLVGLEVRYPLTRRGSAGVADNCKYKTWFFSLAFRGTHAMVACYVFSL